MNIQDLREKSKAFLASDELFYAFLVVMTGITSFGLGRQSDARLIQEKPKTEVVTPYETTNKESTEKSAISITNEVLVGSKNSDKYHLPWCTGAVRIAEENKVYFNSAEEAQAAGYSPAGNCKGL